MQSGQNFNDTTELSTFGFLYGTFPAAPGAFVIATQYNMEVELVIELKVNSNPLPIIYVFSSFRLLEAWFSVHSSRHR